MNEAQPRHEGPILESVENLGEGRLEFVFGVGEGSVPVEVVAPSSIGPLRPAELAGALSKAYEALHRVLNGATSAVVHLRADT